MRRQQLFTSTTTDTNTRAVKNAWNFVYTTTYAIETPKLVNAIAAKNTYTNQIALGYSGDVTTTCECARAQRVGFS